MRLILKQFQDDTVARLVRHLRGAARDSSRYMRAQWQSWEEQSRKQAADAGVTIIDKFDRKPFEDATSALRDEMRADPRFGPLIERILAVQ